MQEQSNHRITLITNNVTPRLRCLSM